TEALHSFPTRRSSDLVRSRQGDGDEGTDGAGGVGGAGRAAREGDRRAAREDHLAGIEPSGRVIEPLPNGKPPLTAFAHQYTGFRSEEHTSELQSRENL